MVGLNRIKTISRVKKKQGKCDLVIIDYLQLVNLKADNKAYNREQEVSMASRTLKALSKELNVPIILLAQLNRSNEMRGDKRPKLSDLRESGAIEQDADIVIFPHRPYYYGYSQDSNGRSTRNYGELIIAKHRNGAVGEVSFYHNDSMTEIKDYVKEDYDNYYEPNPF